MGKIKARPDTAKRALEASRAEHAKKVVNPFMQDKSAEKQLAREMAIMRAIGRGPW